MLKCLSLLFLIGGELAQAGNLELVQVIVVTRHGIRTPYPPDNGTVTDFTSYTNLIFPDNNTWGMTYDAFANQHLTPHGKAILPYLGAYYAEKYANESLDLSSCDNIVCFADDSSRDIDTASLWLKGFGCPDVPVNVVGTDSYPEMQPVLSDHYDVGCPLATEEQVNGLYGGDVDALTEMYRDEIQAVIDIIQQPADSYICQYANPLFDPATESCTLFETGYAWTGKYFQGMFKSPLYYAQYFAETWMLQYVGNLTEWAFGAITLSQLRDLYQMHIETLWFGTNHWNSLAYSSQQLAYIVASMEQFVTGKSVAGCQQPVDTQLLLLASHDTNILYLQRLLDLNWIPFGFSNRVASTGGSLSFELWKDSGDGSLYVKLHYDTASPDQQRNGDVLSLTNPPSVATLVIPDCGDDYCPWETFKSIALASVSLDCIEEPLQSSVSTMSDLSSSGNDDDSNDSWKDWELVVLTAGVCVFVFIVIQVGIYMIGKNKHDEATTSLTLGV